MTFLIYGATGYTGRLRAEHAVERGLRPVLAGRNPDKLRLLAEDLGFEWRALGLAPNSAELQGIKAVLHAAGPFSATAAPMALACIEAGVHYCDIIGEIDVFEALAAMGGRAGDSTPNGALQPRRLLDDTAHGPTGHLDAAYHNTGGIVAFRTDVLPIQRADTADGRLNAC